LSAHVPKSKATVSSETTGISLLDTGMQTVFHIRSFRCPSGCTAIATSPNIVSGREVATVILADLSGLKYWI